MAASPCGRRYSMGYDFMAGEYHNINSGAPPFGNRSLITDPPGGMDDPWGHLPGGDPHPIVASPTVAYIPFGAFGSMDPDINSPRAQQWNVMVEQQLGASWGVSASYLGSYSDRLWAQSAVNPGVFLGLGPCTLNTDTGPRTFPVCSTNANLNQRRALSLENPVKSAQIGALDLNTDIGWQKYQGPEAGRAASERDRREPQRQLYAVEVRGHGHCDDLQSDQRRLFDSGRPGFRRRLLRSGPQAPRDAQRRVPDAGGWQRGRARAGVELAGVGHPQRAIGEPAQHHQRRRPRADRFALLGSAARPAQR